MMIYDHLYEQLPPLVSKGARNDNPGMVLSCRQANLVSHQGSTKLMILFNLLTKVRNSHKPPHDI